MNGTSKAVVTVLILAAFAALVAVLVTVYMLRTAAPIAERGHQLPTATEAFQLRSACADLGQKLLEEDYNYISQNLSTDQISHYNPRTNRCYVEVTKNSAEFGGYLVRYLYDGQTREMLAFAQIKKRKKRGWYSISSTTP